MKTIQAIWARHSVRKYLDKPIEADKAVELQAAIDHINQETGLNIQLMLEEPKAFSGMFISTYGQFSGVRNYFVMAGPKGEAAEEKIGYYGEELVLLAQTLGLNTCWVGLTYKKIPGTFMLREQDIVHCVIALGYGENQGVQHPIKHIKRFFESDVPLPNWFLDGIEAVMLAPSAVNQQKYKFILHGRNLVETRTRFSPWGYTHIDLGIAKYHFEIGAGKDNFRWI